MARVVDAGEEEVGVFVLALGPGHDLPAGLGRGGPGEVEAPSRRGGVGEAQRALGPGQAAEQQAAVDRLIAAMNEAFRIGRANPAARALARAVWPGGLTLVLRRVEGVSLPPELAAALRRAAAERGWIDGDAVARRRLAEAPLSAAKVTKRVVKHAAYLVVSALIMHLFLKHLNFKRLYPMLIESAALSGAFGPDSARICRRAFA